jgi:hypothetical protein
MGKNGKRHHRRKHFAPPPLPKQDEMKSYHSYGVITRFHGGSHRNMEVTVYDASEGKVENIKSTLKGSIRSRKCKQRVVVGSFCIVAYDQVIIILNNDQKESIPSSIYQKLNKVADMENNNEDVVFGKDDITTAFSESESEDDGVAFMTEEDSFVATRVADEEDIDNI